MLAIANIIYHYQLQKKCIMCMLYTFINIMRTNIEIDDTLMEEAFSLVNVRTKKDLIHLALSELIKSKRKKNLLDLAGKIQFHDDYDYKILRGSDAD